MDNDCSCSEWRTFIPQLQYLHQEIPSSSQRNWLHFSNSDINLFLVLLISLFGRYDFCDMKYLKVKGDSRIASGFFIPGLVTASSIQTLGMRIHNFELHIILPKPVSEHMLLNCITGIGLSHKVAVNSYDPTTRDRSLLCFPLS